MTLLAAEGRRELRLLWSYRLNTVGWYGMWLAIFPLMLLIFDQVTGGYGAERRAQSLLGFLIWDLCIMGVMASTATGVGQEAGQGTLESWLLAPWSPQCLLTLRIAVRTVLQVGETALLGLVLALVVQPELRPHVAALAVFGLVLLTAYGLSMVLGGLALVVKQLQGMIGLIGLVAVLFTGALAPLNDLGPGFVLVKWLVPLAWGIDALRQTLLQGAGWAALAGDGTWWGLVAQAGLWIWLGRVVFAWAWRRARQGGLLASY